MRVHSPTSRSGSRIYLSIWDLFWALVSPIAALYLRDIDIQSNADWSVIASYWVLSAGFAILAFFAFRLQDGMTRYFSVHEALDIAEAVLFAELMTFAVLFTLTRLDGIPRSMPLVHGLLLAGGLLAARVFVRIVAMHFDRYLKQVWLETGGKGIACTGDLIYGDGQLFDLSSLQDAVPEAKARGYHGYAARAGELIQSLRKIEARKPDVLVPARGPLIENPQQAINRLIGRLRDLMASHFATDALRWYWGDDNLRLRSRTGRRPHRPEAPRGKIGNLAKPEAR